MKNSSENKKSKTRSSRMKALKYPKGSFGVFIDSIMPDIYDIYKKLKTRSSRMKVIGNTNDVSYGVHTASVSLRNYFTSMAFLMNAFGLSWKKIEFRTFPGVSPAQSGGNWLYLSRRKEPAGSPGSDIILPQVITIKGNDYGKFIFYTDDGRNSTAITSFNRDEFKSKFAANLGRTYQDWSNEFGDVFFMN